MRECHIARVVVSSHERIAMEFVSVTIRFVTVRKCSKVFKGVRGCSQSVRECSQVFMDVHGCS
jgi:hypothetical protein